MNDNLTFSRLAISDDDLMFIVASDGRMRKMTWADTVLPVNAVFNDVVETTLPTITIDDTDIEKNLISFDSALDGSSVVCYYLNDV